MEDQLYQHLQDLNIEFEKFEHKPFFTCEESDHFYQHSSGAHCKTLFLRNKKKSAYFLAVVESHNRVDTKELCKFLEQSGGKLSFASAEDLEHFLGIQPGSVTPFALLHPNSSQIHTVLIDDGLFEHEHVHFHPLRNTATLKLKTSDFEKFLGSQSHKQQRYKF